MPFLFLNGRIVDAAEAALSPEDRGFLLGDGLFETLRAYGGKVFRLGAHLGRLRASAEFFRLSLPYSDEQIEQTIADLLLRNACPEAYVRITLTRGCEVRTLRLDTQSPPTVLIAARALSPYPPEQYRSGAKLIISKYRQNSASPLARHKNLNYLLFLLARQEAADQGANGAILLNEHGQVTEESLSNLFAVRDGTMLTPPVHCGLLPGVTRATVLELAAEMGLECRETPIAAGEIFDCDEVFLTNSLMEIMPVRTVDKRPLRTPAPGALTLRLMDAYQALRLRECSVR